MCMSDPLLSSFSSLWSIGLVDKNPLLIRVRVREVFWIVFETSLPVSSAALLAAKGSNNYGQTTRIITWPSSLSSSINGGDGEGEWFLTIGWRRVSVPILQTLPYLLLRPLKCHHFWHQVPTQHRVSCKSPFNHARELQSQSRFILKTINSIKCMWVCGVGVHGAYLIVTA